MYHRFKPLFAAVLAALLSTQGLALAADKRQPDPTATSTEGFLSAHPDLRYRQSGFAAYQAGDHTRAFSDFKRAAHFADKPSQGMLAEMLWDGVGVEKDRALAYAWMDLAAERYFKVMLIKREVYWEALDEAERERAISVGQALYAQYGDDVAKSRLERVLHRGRMQTTGSKTGTVGTGKIEFQTPSGPISIDATSYYHPDYWEPERYWAWQDKHWKEPPTSEVKVGPLETSDTKD